jgi:murein DD-endopeptidase MepM/ murein hydrolase activator NlpD
MNQSIQVTSFQLMVLSTLLWAPWMGVPGSFNLLKPAPAQAVASSTIALDLDLSEASEPTPAAPTQAADLGEAIVLAAPAPEAAIAPAETVAVEPPVAEAVAPTEIVIPEAPAAESLAPVPEEVPSTVPSISPETSIESDSTVVPDATTAVDSNRREYVDTTDYSLGATPSKPAAEPLNQVIITERTTGCQAAFQAGEGVPATLCASTPTLEAPRQVEPVVTAPKPARTVYTGITPKIKPLQLASLPTSATAAVVPPSVTFTGTLSPAASTPTPYTASAYPTATVPRSYGGMQPLKWLVPKLSRLMFPLPFPVPITSAFGWRIHPISGITSFHLGAETGTPILAAETGKVTIADWLGGYGLSVLLEHSEGQFATRYAHLSQMFVQPGQWVEKGTVIGLVGSTGNSTGPHLHYELLQRTPEGLVAVDPSAELKQALAQLVKALQTAQAKPQQGG